MKTPMISSPLGIQSLVVSSLNSPERYAKCYRPTSCPRSVLAYYCSPAGEPGPQFLESYQALIWCTTLQGVAKGSSSKLTALSGHKEKKKKKKKICFSPLEVNVLNIPIWSLGTSQDNYFREGARKTSLEPDGLPTNSQWFIFPIKIISL